MVTMYLGDKFPGIMLDGCQALALCLAISKHEKSAEAGRPALKLPQNVYFLLGAPRHDQNLSDQETSPCSRPDHNSGFCMHYEDMEIIMRYDHADENLWYKHYSGEDLASREQQNIADLNEIHVHLQALEERTQHLFCASSSVGK